MTARTWPARRAVDEPRAALVFHEVTSVTARTWRARHGVGALPGFVLEFDEPTASGGARDTSTAAARVCGEVTP